MSDYIQALELQITSSTTAAHKSLDELAAALNKIRTAVGGTPKKLGTAVALENLANSIHKNLGADTTKMVQNLADSMKNLLDQARQLKDFRYAMSMVKAAVDTANKPSESLGSAVSDPHFTVSYANEIADANKEVTESFRDTADEIEKIMPRITPDKQLKTALADMFENGEIKARMYGRVLEEISRIDFNEGLGAHGKPDLFGDGEAKQWIRDLERNLQLDDAEGMSSGPKAIAEETAKAVEQMSEMAPKMEEVKEEARMTAEQIADIGRAAVEANGQLGFMQMELQAKQQALGQGIMDGSMDPAKIARAGQEIIRLQERIEKLKEEQEKAAEASREHESALKRLKEAALRGSSVFGQLGHRLKSLLVFRVFRTLLREVSDGFKTGLENVRKYGEAVNSLYYRDMSGLDNTLLKMKNSLGASLTAALRSVIPLFQQLASWVITVSNYVNQFFALLNGQSTWTRAVDVQTDALEDQQKAASGAAKATKNLLASWDELNIIQSAGGGGGAGSAAEDLSQYERMFEEVGTFDNRIREAINWIRDHMNEIYGIAAGIAALLLGARFSVSLVIAGITTSFVNGKQSGANGDSFKDAIGKNIIGVIETALGGAMLGFTVGGVGGALIGFTIGALVSVVATYIGWEQGRKEAGIDTESFATRLPRYIESAAGGALLGVGVALLAGATVGGALLTMSIAAVAGVMINELIFDDSQKTSVDFNRTTFVDHLRDNAYSILSMGIGGMLLGVKLGGIYGGAIGLALGLTAGIVIDKIIFDSQKQAAFNSAIAAIQSSIQDRVNEEMFGAEVVAKITVLDTKIEELETSKRAVESARAELAGAWTIAVSVGLANLTETDLTNINTKAQALVSAITEHLEKEKTVIELGVGLFSGAMSEEELAKMVDLTEVINSHETDFNAIGVRLGEILARGTTEGYEDVITNIMSILQQTELNARVAAAQADFNATVMSAASSEGTPVERLFAFSNAYEEAMQGLESTASAQVAAEYQTTVRALRDAQTYAQFTDEQLAEMGLENTQAYYVQQAETLSERAAQYRDADYYRDRINAYKNEIAGGANEYFLTTNLALWEAIAEDYGGLYDENGGLRDKWDIARIAYDSGYGFMREGAATTLHDALLSGMQLRARTSETESAAATEVIEEVAQQVRDSVWRIWSLDEDDVQSLSAPEGFSARDAVGQLHGNDFDYFIFRTDDGSFVLWDDVNSLPMSVSQGILDQIDEWYTQRNGGTPTGGGGGAPSVSENDTNDDVRDNERNAMLRQLITLAQEIAKKDWTVTPSAGWGAFNAKSGQLYASVKG